MKHYLRLIAILLIPLALIALYGMSDYTFIDEELRLEKADFSDLRDFLHPEVGERRAFVADSLLRDSIRRDSIIAERKRREELVDTASQRILLFGDSMTEFLGQRMADYAAQNGHELTLVCWYSSNTRLWAESDTLRHFMRKVRPTFVMMTVGGNEQFVRDLPQREENIRRILDTVGDVPHIWICTPAWKQDTGINDIAKRLAGKGRFYDSRKLTLERGADHAHPTRSEAYRWMDSLAVWMQSEETEHPIRMKRPEKGVRRAYHSYVLQPVEQKH